jgi:two-component system, NtrC family, sensor histidine kinase HydH
MDTLAQTSLLVAVTSFALGFSVLSQNVRNKLFISFAMMTSLISMWSFSFFLSKVWEEPAVYRLHLFTHVMLVPASLAFIRVMIRIQDNGSRRLFSLSVLLACALDVLLLFHFESHAWFRQVIYYFPILVVIQILLLMWIDFALKKGRHRDPKIPTVGLGRRNWIYLGGLLVLTTSVLDHAPWLGPVIPSFGNLILSVYIFFISQAITQQRLLNISALFSRFVVLLVVAFTLTAVYSLLVAWVENSPALFFLNSFIASFFLLTLLDPLRSLVSYFTQRLLTQTHRRLQQRLREAQRNLTGIVDLATLAQEVLSTVAETLYPEWGALFVLRSDGAKFRRVRVMGRELILDTHLGAVKPSLREVLANHPILQYCEDLAQKGHFPIVLDQILESEMDRSASRVQRAHYARLIEALKAFGSNLLIPFVDSKKILGFIALRVPAPPEPWGNNWGMLPILYPYFEQVAQTMQNLEVYVKLREKERLAALGEMAAGLAHEIRNPLGAIKGAAQFLDPSANRPESRFLKVIVEEVDRLNRVVTQFLDYSKPPTADFQQVDLSRLAEKTIELMRPTIRPDVHLEFSPARSPVKVMASAEQIRQVLINLIQNAQNALESRKNGTIRVSVGQEGEETNGEVALVVEDTGHGIKKEHLDKIFIPFFTTCPSGTGLGLSISHKIVEAHRGRIEVVSEEERFTRFSVILPKSKE